MAVAALALPGQQLSDDHAACSAQAMRLFVGEPIWTPFNRPQEEHPSRVKYTTQFGKQPVAVAAS